LNQLDQSLNDKREFIIKAIYYGLWAGMVFLLLYYGLGLVTPFVFAFLFAYVLRRLAVKTRDKIHLPLRLLCVIYVFLFYSTLGVLISLLGISAVAKLAEFVANIPNLYDSLFQPLLGNIFETIQKAILRMDPTISESLTGLYDQLLKSVGTMLANLSGWMLAWISGLVSSVPGMAIKLLLMIIATFFAAMDFDRFTNFVSRQISPERKMLLIHIRDYLTGTVLRVIRAYATIMSITAIELSIGLTIIGIPNAILVAIAIAIFDILPVLGTGGIMIPWAVVTLILGDYKLALAILAVYVVVTIVRNIIEPKIVGPQLGLHPLVTLISLFVGAQLLGVLGLFGFPITLSLLLHLNNKGVIHIFK
jgi:sporulation integral membrane protein YtvI